MTTLYNIAKMTSSTIGTGTFTLVAAVPGFLTFALAGVPDGAVVPYSAREGANTEFGTGTVGASGTTLTRSVTKSTNADALVSFSGAVEVAITPRAEDMVNKTGDTMTGSLVVPNASGLKIKDTDASHTLGFVGGSNLTADRTLTVTTGDANRALTMTADASIGGTNTGDQTAASLGLGTSDSPQFAGVNVGHASDTTITRTAAGDIAVEGNAIYRAGGTDVAVADGGTGASTLAANNVLLGNGTSALQTVAPSTSGNVLTSNGTTWTSAAPSSSGGKAADQQVFTTSGTWTKPSGYGANAIAYIQSWGGGGGAGRSTGANLAGGGGGGGYSERWILLSALGSTETVTIGAGGAGRTGSMGTGTAGGNTTFGSLVTAYGGGGGGNNTPGGGGSDSGAGASAINYIPMVMAADATPTVTKYSPVQPPHPHFGGTGKSYSYSPYYTAANAVFGGGGGGGNGQTGGTSQNGGAGGNSAATPTAGTQPGGGGGGSSSANADGAAGAAGMCIVTVFDGA